MALLVHVKVAVPCSHNARPRTELFADWAAILIRLKVVAYYTRIVFAVVRVKLIVYRVRY